MTDIVLDACCLINLLAAGHILSPPPGKGSSKTKSKGGIAIASKLHVPDAVAEETLYILQPDGDDPTTLVKSKVDLSTLLEAEVLCECGLGGGEETGLFVQFAVRLDDGEANSLAIAKSRSWTLATDDRVATRLAGELEVEVVNTAQLVRTWADASVASAEKIAETLANIQTYAKFIPRSGSPDSEWWYQYARKV